MVAKNRANRGQDELPSGKAKGLGEPPASLDKEAREHWSRLARLLEDAKLAKPFDADGLEFYCVCYSRWRRAERQLAKPAAEGGGEVIRTINGYYQKNPWLEIATEALKEMRIYLNHFGLTPKARGETKGAGEGEGEDLLLAYFSGDTAAQAERKRRG
jgi:P27 family predicted phage terminase small subunit